MTEHSGVHLYSWMKQINSVVPPFCVEIFLKDNQSYFLHSVLHREDSDPMVLLRIWDLREIKDIQQLKEAMGKVKDRDEYNDAGKIYPNLDWANLRIPKEYIAYAIEWHDRLWGRDLIGFQSIEKH